MSEKVTCPYCGYKMMVVTHKRKHATGSFVNYCDAYALCPACSSKGPALYVFAEKAQERATAAALRRYAPPNRPLTLEEVKEKKGVWIEDPCCVYEDKLYPAIYWGVGNIRYSVFIADIDDGEEKAWYYSQEYGETWRCWERKPTQEEMEAAEWKE